mmetsp:Transcript_35479/g.56565  ORF Transcript_35479/g.56565 Transcript_35479/m.56565 type:complete len:234 (+) Transcript_35479:29-730(+)
MASLNAVGFFDKADPALTAAKVEQSAFFTTFIASMPLPFLMARIAAFNEIASPCVNPNLVPAVVRSTSETPSKASSTSNLSGVPSRLDGALITMAKGSRTPRGKNCSMRCIALKAGMPIGIRAKRSPEILKCGRLSNAGESNNNTAPITCHGRRSITRIILSQWLSSLSDLIGCLSISWRSSRSLKPFRSMSTGLRTAAPVKNGPAVKSTAGIRHMEVTAPAITAMPNITPVP